MFVNRKDMENVFLKVIAGLDPRSPITLNAHKKIRSIKISTKMWYATCPRKVPPQRYTYWI